MKPLSRRGVSKGRSAQAFRSDSGRTKGANLKLPTRGGFRF